MSEEREQLHITLSEITEDFMISVDTMGALVHSNALVHGWWDSGERNFGELIALMHSELSEALEWFRKEGMDAESDHIDGMNAIAEELADVVIRIMDACGGYNLDLPKAICEKMKFNIDRSYKHGNKKI